MAELIYRDQTTASLLVMHTDQSEGTDPPGHHYTIRTGDNQIKRDIDFQCGPIREVGVNGVQNEHLLAIMIHRTKILNERFPCRENALAITKMEEALMWFEKRTKDRQKRGVEGFNKA